jgi:hypothetical protein
MLADRALRHCRHRIFIIDPLVPPPFVARLVFESYTELAPTLHMVLDGPVAKRGPHVALLAVTTSNDWRVLQDLVRTHHVEAPSTV